MTEALLKVASELRKLAAEPSQAKITQLLIEQADVGDDDADFLYQQLLRAPSLYAVEIILRREGIHTESGDLKPLAKKLSKLLKLAEVQVLTARKKQPAWGKDPWYEVYCTNSKGEVCSKPFWSQDHAKAQQKLNRLGTKPPIRAGMIVMKKYISRSSNGKVVFRRTLNPQAS